LLGKSARGNTHNQHPIFDEFYAAVLAEWTLHHGWPDLSRAIDETEVDAAKPSRESVE
jgi:hypothetical protein